MYYRLHQLTSLFALRVPVINGKSLINPKYTPHQYAKLVELFNPLNWQNYNSIPDEAHMWISTGHRFINRSLVDWLLKEAYTITGECFLNTSLDVVQLSVVSTGTICTVNDANFNYMFTKNWHEKPIKEKKPQPVKPTLSNVTQLLKQIPSDAKLVSVDFEFWEHNQSKILELGVSTLHNGKITSEHFLNVSTRLIANGKYVPNHKRNFEFGTTEICDLTYAAKYVADIVNSADFIFGQEVSGDISVLNKFASINPKITVINTADFFTIFDLPRRISLSKLCNLAGIETKFPHNAGNDCHYGAQLMHHVLNKHGK